MIFTAADKVQFKLIRDVLYDNVPELTLYLGAMEAATSTDKTTVTVNNIVRKVMSVWLATDSDYEGTNYYSDPDVYSYSVKDITLDTELPFAVTDVVVAYYSDCATCGWNDRTQSGRDSLCATCNGTGMVLALGDAVTIPVKPLKRGSFSEKEGVFGQEFSGLFAFNAKVEHENAIKAAMEMYFGGEKLVERDDETGELNSLRLYNIAGELREIRVLTQYEKWG